MGGELTIETLFDSDSLNKRKQIELDMQAAINKFGVSLAGKTMDQISTEFTNTKSSFNFRGGNVIGKSGAGM